ncbi:MAG TPA: trypsin-like peptidase domain-containing protein [Candidatus Faecousia excrementigallinarum]|uniref:Trypsin-like peptidase domain-containing protein n=1 Tax=Candidatus Faecousia excrementigallinarum TaxID=2840806 RepID=A0A9D0Z3U0_9FIRM|nr:trypsin-like peptidase domain-containing protein [Candidatus Faecousia excrementigallinarum]
MENNMENNFDSYESNEQPRQEEYTEPFTQPEPPVQPEPPIQAAPKKKKSMGPKLVALSLCFALVGGVAGGAGVLWYTSGKSPVTNTSNALMGNRENSVIALNSVDTGKELTAAEVYAQNVRSTVGITTSITTNFWGYQTVNAASGSGFIVTDDGYILTNYHVVEDADSITVSMYEGQTYEAELVGFDASNDVAVLKIEAEGLTPVVLGDSDNLNVGDNVVAIGNPLGELTFSLTSGAISSLNRNITMSNGSTMNLMQTDCAINSGNSGGALFNMYGEVIGITNAKYSSNGGGEASIDNIGFAIPINLAWEIAQSIIEKGYVSTPYIGVTVSDVGQQFQNYGLPQGAAVQSVVEGGPAEKAGLQANDIITHIGGEEITGYAQLSQYIREAGVGGQLKLTVFRQGETLEITVTIGETRQQNNG